MRMILTYEGSVVRSPFSGPRFRVRVKRATCALPPTPRTLETPRALTRGGFSNDVRRLKIVQVAHLTRSDDPI